MSNSTINPFPDYITDLNQKLYIEVSENYFIQTYFLSGAFAVLIILQLIALIVRYKNNSFWVLRVVKTKSGSFYLPNGLICWNISSASFLLVIQFFYAAMRRYAEPPTLNLITGVSTGGGNLRYSMYWRTLLWIPLYWGAWAMTVGTILAPVLSTSIIGQANNSRLSRHPIVLNIALILLPIITLAVVVPLSVLLNNTYNDTFEQYLVLYPLLVQGYNAFESGNLASMPDSKVLLALETSLLIASANVIDAWNRIFTAWYILVGILMIIFIGASIVHFKSLGTSITNLRMKKSTSGTYSEEMRSLTWSFRSLVFSSTLVMCVAFSYFIFDIILSASASTLSSESGVVLSQVLVLGCGYVYLLFGGLAIIITFTRSFTSTTSNQVTSTISLNDTKITLPSSNKPFTPKSLKSKSGAANKARGGITNKFTFAQTVHIQMDEEEEYTSTPTLNGSRRIDPFELHFESKDEGIFSDISLEKEKDDVIRPFGN